ncbi:MAG: DUF4344 domain-containing metallopeptidase [Alphaproteobacteria bacterium]
MLLTLDIEKIGRVPARVIGVMLFILTLLVFGAPPSRAGAAANSRDEEYERLFVLANTEFTLLHELAHVLIWELKPPIFGREEDAADTIAVMAQMMVPAGAQADAGNEIEKLHAVADGWKLEWKLIQEDELETAYWDLHALEIQRYYTIACLVYGADPGNRAGIKQAAQLPVERAEWCHEEYALAKSAMDWLEAQFAPGPEYARKPKRGEVTVSYMRNSTVEGEKLDQWLRQSGLAERLARAMNQRFDLPRDILISFESCPFPNAAWDVKTAKIQFCHSLLNRFLYLARELSKESGGAADSTVWSAAIDRSPEP